jgi:hypothetical protein
VDNLACLYGALPLRSAVTTLVHRAFVAGGVNTEMELPIYRAFLAGCPAPRCASTFPWVTVWNFGLCCLICLSPFGNAQRASDCRSTHQVIPRRWHFAWTTSWMSTNRLHHLLGSSAPLHENALLNIATRDDGLVGILGRFAMMRTASCQCRGFRVVVEAEPDTRLRPTDPRTSRATVRKASSGSEAGSTRTQNSQRWTARSPDEAPLPPSSELWMTWSRELGILSVATERPRIRRGT